MERPACLDALGDAAVEAFDAADAYYFKSMARTQRLRAVRNAAHTDLSAREVDAACGAVEHLLHILRAQRRAVASAAEAEAALAVVADATEALRGDGVPPPQRATREWTVRQRDTLDGRVAAAAAAKLVHKAVSAAESTPMLRPGSSAAGAAAATLAKVSDTFAAARSTLAPSSRQPSERTKVTFRVTRVSASASPVRARGRRPRWRRDRFATRWRPTSRP